MKRVFMTGRVRATRSRLRLRFRFALVLVLSLSLLSGGCFEEEKGETFYGRVQTPRAQEFRWSNGGLPRVFDPALAANPPDTDAVRALFEGLTDYDSRTLKPVSAVATHWESSPDKRTWTFHLRADARWSNGDPVTAHDFVRSWRRILNLGERAPHASLLENIEGKQTPQANITNQSQPKPPSDSGAVAKRDDAARKATESGTGKAAEADGKTETSAKEVALEEFGARAINDRVLVVRLKRPDRNFPALVAHPVFRPVYEVDAGEASQDDVAEPQVEELEEAKIISNGAFRLSKREPDGVVLERAANYWAASTVELERVRFVATRDAEEALASYRAGEVDAVTNAAFEPLALKLLAPYKDFRRATYGALTYYVFNTARAPFGDARVRRALALAVNRDRLTTDTLNGVVEPAKKFLPQAAISAAESDAEANKKPEEKAASKPVVEVQEPKTMQESTAEPTPRAEPGVTVEEKGGAPPEAESQQPAETQEDVAPLDYDAAEARRLLAEAGFPNGENFPPIRLVVNRNEQQRVVAQTISSMWRNTLGVQTEIVVLSWDDYEAALRAGDFDVARRGMVMQTTDEETNMLALFSSGRSELEAVESAEPTPSPRMTPGETAPDKEPGETATGTRPSPIPTPLLTEAQVLRELPGFPVYFASSYALVKPYVIGFESNLLDAPSLKNVRLDPTWTPPQESERIRFLPGP